MLQIITGQDRVSLSNWVLDSLCAEAGQGRENLILIVPEQFSHEAERRLCEVGGDSISRFAEVLSLSRLSDRVAASAGGIARAHLDKGGQLLAMALAAEQVASRMKFYGAVLRRPEFLADMVRMVNEFRSYCVEPEALLEIARSDQGEFAVKLEELGLLYGAYLAVCTAGSADPTDKLLRLQEQLTETAWAETRRFYVDGFSDFTGAELSILEALIRTSEQVTVALGTGPAGSVLPRLARNTSNQLQNLAKKWSIPCSVQQLQTFVPRASRVQQMLQSMFSTGTEVFPADGQICLQSFDSVEEECRAAVLQIKELLSSGARCREISVACTDLPRYRAALDAALRTADLSAYFAGEADLLSRPVVGSVLNALEAAAGPMEYEDVALYLKSGLPDTQRDVCDRLDNYAYLWNLRGSQWEKPWELHPAGFGRAWTEEDQQHLERLNLEKDPILRPLLRLRRGLYSSRKTADMVLVLADFLEELRLQQRLEERANAYAAAGQGQLAQELLQLYEILRQAMEQMWLILGETERTPEDLCHLLRLLLTQYTVGTIPAGIDQIHVSDLPDLRHRTAKYLLLLGANDGALPAYQTAEGILTEEERRRLQYRGISIAPGRADQMDQQMYRIYAAVSAVQSYLSMSCCGEQPAWLFRRAAAICPDAVKAAQSELFLDVPSLAAWRLRHGVEAPVEMEGLEVLERELRKRCGYQFTPLQRQTVHGLYGRAFQLSASKIDQYANCKWMFFLTYGLRAKPRKQARLDPSAFGDFVHAVLEQTVRRVNALGGFRRVDEETIISVAQEEIDAYASQYFPEQAQRNAYLFSRSQKEILEIVRDLGEELRSSGFQPAACELSFSGRDGALPAVEIRAEQAISQISGFVDRVDLYEENGRTYVRVVDYKTGKKSFDYTDVLNGIGLQMLIYLFALREFGGEFFGTGDMEPAGVLYLPARREFPLVESLPEEEDVAKAHEKLRRRKGLIRSDAHLLAAMEEDPDAPRFMPYKSTKAGPAGDLADYRQMVLLERHVLRTLEQMTDHMACGNVAPDPIVRGPITPCNYCDYRSVCHKDLGTQSPRVLSETGAALFWEKLEQEEQNHG